MAAIINGFTGAFHAVTGTVRGVAHAIERYSAGVEVEDVAYGDIPRLRGMARYCQGCEKVVKQRARTDGLPNLRHPQRDVVVERRGGRIRYSHRDCALVGRQGWIQRTAVGARQIGSAMIQGIKTHPVKAAIIATAMAATAVLAVKAIQESAVDSHIYCLVDSATNEVWCTTKRVTESAVNAVFERFDPTTIYTHSGDFATRAYNELAGGSEVILRVTRQYFAQNPLPNMMSKAARYFGH